MNAYIFPGQGSQFIGMGKDLYEKSTLAASMFEQANEILGFKITDLMFAGAEEDLKQTKVTQPAIFLHSVILAAAMGQSFKPDMVAGHSLGEYSALVASQALSFEDGLRLVSKRANAMQKACELNPSTMAAILGLDDNVVEEICASISEIVVPANYNSPGQIVISGSNEGIDKAIEILKEKGAKRAIKLAVSGAFHSPLMEPARLDLENAINNCRFNKPVCTVYQNVTAQACSDPAQIKLNLARQLTAPVLWTQSSINMITAGAKTFIEVGPGSVLQGLVKKVNKEIVAESAIIG
jgi:[acyl-carrier-protein] S-malonyltransferase